MEIIAKIENVDYKPKLCRTLPEYDFSDLEEALAKSSFLLNLKNRSKVAISRWVTPKRTRSYPYARVYDTLSFKPRITIIPVMKDEGIDGDRDYLQFDTISMMNLLDIYVIPAYYVKAVKNTRDLGKQKITKQEFDVEYIKKKILEIFNYHFGPIHWNINQIEQIKAIGQKSIDAYSMISSKTGVLMHRTNDANERFKEIGESLEKFKSLSRHNAELAAYREVHTFHEKESTVGEKPTLIIENYLGGKYYLTVDEIRIDKVKKIIQLIEAKNTTNALKPFTSIADIKDAIFKMIIFTNLENLIVDGEAYMHESIVKLTSLREFNFEKLEQRQKEQYEMLKLEAQTNNFSIIHQ